MSDRTTWPKVQSHRLFVERLSEARGGAYRGVYEVEWYCENSRCVMRELRATLKELDGPAKYLKPVQCPVCHGPLKTHYVIDRVKRARVQCVDGADLARSAK